ncbi:MAG: UDP-N-acetylmuramate--L-alanine ligase [Chlamydiae bacterium]|nr:UDP-N-acetylmuramate--L-alanine ligase [Chlamydiota bacterium]
MRESYHLLGIGGIGMSALAHILIEKGESVTGSDQRSAESQELPSQATVVYSSAIRDDHPEILSAKEQKLPLLHRSEMLKILLEGKCALLVAGTHGKTSTSALLSWVLQSAGLEPTYAVGGIVRNFKKNGGFGLGPHFVAEADESDGSFLNYTGEGAIITNVEKEHLNYWKSKEKIVLGFQKFIRGIKDPNLLFWCSDDPVLRELAPPGIPYGKSGELCMKNYRQEGINGIFTASFKGKLYEEIELPLMGEINALNALAVFGMALQLGLSEREIRTAFRSYQGVKRRLERVGEVNRITLYDDYAHHPTEIQVTLSALREAFKKRRLIILFQPHRYTRTRELDFRRAFDLADLAIITDIYSAGEEPIKGLSGSTFYKQLQADNAIYLAKEKLLPLLPKILVPGDLLVTVGAGDITELPPKLLRRL